MRTVFADTLYWIAIVRPNDPWTEPAKKAKSTTGNARIVTTDEVLIEFLNALASGGEHLRRQGAKMVKAILQNPNVRVLAQSRDSFLRGIEFYEGRADKEYSLTDCISMNAMKADSLTEVLTNDHHFEQEGFVVLMVSEKMAEQ